MVFSKFLSIFTIVLLLVSSDVLSMEEDTFDEGTELFNRSIKAKSCYEKSEELHWGLAHWVAGIGEYFERCFCCDTPSDKNRSIIIKNRDGEIKETTDCCYISITASGNWNRDCCNNPRDCYNNPIAGTICLPLATICHLCLLPCICCCGRNRSQTVEYEREREPYIPIPATFKTSEQIEADIKADMKRRRKILESIRPDDSPETKKRKYQEAGATPWL